MTYDMLTRRDFARLLLGGGITWASTVLVGCGTANDADASGDGKLADGSYPIEAETDSSMFHADSCTLVVEGGKYRATLVLPGEGFSRLYYGSAEEAAQAADADIYDYYLNDEGKYTFDLPVRALDEELTIAAFGHRRDKWYDHTIIFHAPSQDGQPKEG